MPKTPGQIHMYDKVKIYTIVFEIVGGGAFKALPPGSLTVWNSPDRIGLMVSLWAIEDHFIQGNAVSKLVPIIGFCIMCKPRLKCSLGSLARLSTLS